MTNLKKFLVATAAAGAMAGSAFAAETGATISYVGSTSPPATLAITGGTYGYDDSGTTHDSLFGVGNTITFTLSQGTFSAAPIVTGGGGATLSFVSGGVGANSVTYQFTAAPGGSTVTLSGVTVAGLTNVADSGSTAAPTAVAVTGTSNVATFNSLSAANRTGNLATFTNAVTATPTAVNATVDVIADANDFVGGDPASLGSVAIAVGGQLNYSNAALVPGNPTATFTIPFAAGSLTSADVGGTCAPTPASFTTASTPAVGASLAVAGTVVAPCTMTLSLDSASLAAAPLAAGPSSVAVNVPLTNAPAGAVTAAAAAALGTVSYVGGRLTNLNYAVGNGAGYQYYVFVNNIGATSLPVYARIGNFQAKVGTNIAIGGNRLISADEIRTALLAAGAPSTTLQDPSARTRLQLITGTDATVTPLLRDASGIVTEVGTDFTTGTYQ